MGKSRKLRLEAEEKWPDLQQFLASYLHEDWDLNGDTPEAVIDFAAAKEPLNFKKEVVRQWWDWNAKVGWQSDPRRAVEDGLGVEVMFESPSDARTFMNRVYDKLIVDIRQHEKGWKP